MNKLKLHKPVTMEDVQKMGDIEKRRLLVRDILLQIDLGLMDGITLGYINNNDIAIGGACHVCFVGAGYVAGKNLTGTSQNDDESYHEFIAKFGFQLNVIYQIENVFEDNAHEEQYESLRKIFNALYPGFKGRTGRLRAIYQYIWDNPECQFVALEPSE